ncbi:hypothetical protein D3C84_1165710 [compost metagenome]
MTNQISMADMLNAFDSTAPDSDPELSAALSADLAQLLAEVTVADDLAKKRAINEALTQKASRPHLRLIVGGRPIGE